MKSGVIPTAKKVDTFLAVLCLTAETLRVSAFLGCGLYSLAWLAQPDRGTGPSLIPRGAFLAYLGAATGAAVAALIPANMRVIFNRRWYQTLSSVRSLNETVKHSI